MKLHPLIEDPPVEDSPHFSDEEVASAVDTNSVGELAAQVSVAVSAGNTPSKYELLRRGESLYVRVTFGAEDKVLVCRADWLGV